MDATQLDPAAAEAAAAAAEAALREALGRIGFDEDAQEAVITVGGFHQIAFVGIVGEAAIACTCKIIRTRAENPIPLTIVQEQLPSSNAVLGAESPKLAPTC
jgi:hypothetical protein